MSVPGPSSQHATRSGPIGMARGTTARSGVRHTCSWSVRVFVICLRNIFPYNIIHCSIRGCSDRMGGAGSKALRANSVHVATCAGGVGGENRYPAPRRRKPVSLLTIAYFPGLGHSGSGVVCADRSSRPATAGRRTAVPAGESTRDAGRDGDGPVRAQERAPHRRTGAGPFGDRAVTARAPSPCLARRRRRSPAAGPRQG